MINKIKKGEKNANPEGEKEDKGKKGEGDKKFVQRDGFYKFMQIRIP